MVRNYKKKIERPADREKKLEAAVKLVSENNMSVTTAAKKEGVPRETLRRWVEKGAPSRPYSGSFQSVLTPREEGDIIEAIITAAKFGWPCGTIEIQHMVKEFLDSSGKTTVFKDNFPGKDWIIEFKRRHNNQIRPRKAELLTKAREKTLTSAALEEFFALLKDSYDKADLFNDENAARRIFNTDETGLNTNPNQRKLFFKKATKDAYLISPNCGKAVYTVLVAGDAAEEFLPPLIVYKATHFNANWTFNGPEDARYAVSESGWMSDIIFEQWFCDTFVPYLEELQKPVILNYDGHGFHLTYKTVKVAIMEKITIICLPPHTSHALQALDVGVFKGMKAAWRIILFNFYHETRMIGLSKGSFPTLLKKLWRQKNLPASLLASEVQDSGHLILPL